MPHSAAEAIDAMFAAAPVVPVLVIEDAAHAVPLARALVAGGLPVLEVTLRSAAALDAIRRIAADVPGATVGAGTVLNPAQFAACQMAGARFIVAPGATEPLYAAARDSGLPFLPGIATASEAMVALDHGCRHAKFFPAEAAGGIRMLTSFAGPFRDLRFCPTGGITEANLAAYAALPNVFTVGGSWLAPAAALRVGDWAAVTDLARRAVAITKGA